MATHGDGAATAHKRSRNARNFGDENGDSHLISETEHSPLLNHADDSDNSGYDDDDFGPDASWKRDHSEFDGLPWHKKPSVCQQIFDHDY
jgi:hypothetical protein